MNSSNSNSSVSGRPSLTQSLVVTASPSAYSYICQRNFLYAAVVIAVLSLKNSFYISSLSDQIDYFDAGGTDKLVNQFFAIIFPLGGFVTIPLSALLLQHFKEQDSVIFLTILFLGLLHAGLNMTDDLTTQYIAAAVFAILRSLKWCAFSEYVIKHGSLSHLGLLFGTANTIVGVCNLLVYPLYYLSKHPNNGDFFTSNLLLTIMEILCLAFPIYLNTQEHKGVSGSLSSNDTNEKKTEFSGGVLDDDF
jgi:hypothetical protein